MFRIDNLECDTLVFAEVLPSSETLASNITSKKSEKNYIERAARRKHERRRKHKRRRQEMGKGSSSG